MGARSNNFWVQAVSKSSTSQTARRSAMLGSQNAEEIQGVLEKTEAALRQLKEGQTKQAEKFKELVDQANCIRRAVICAENRQDAYSADGDDVRRWKEAAGDLSPRSKKEYMKRVHFYEVQAALRGGCLGFLHYLFCQ